MALGIDAVRHRVGAYFVTLHRLVDELKPSRTNRRLERRLSIYSNLRLLILGEFGYIPLLPRDAANPG